jgi:Ran GTPase-activating protein (RanGAP) involved in mRNA processing and transport
MAGSATELHDERERLPPEMGDALRVVRERVMQDMLPLLSLLQVEPLQSSHLSFQEYFAARAICEGTRLSGAPPWQWPVWWANTVKIGSEMGDVFGKGLLQASGVDGDSLDLAQKLGGDRPTVLAVLTAVMGSLTSVHLGGNALGAEGAKPIAEAISVSKSLTSVDVGSNEIGREMALELVAIFKQKQLTFVGLASCSLGAAGGKVVADYISVSKSLTSIKLSSNDLDAEAAEALGPAISVSKSLTAINLMENDVGPEGAKALGPAISVSK